MRECFRDYTSTTGGFCRLPDEIRTCPLRDGFKPSEKCPYYVEIKNDKEDNNEMKNYKLTIKKREFVAAREKGEFVDVEFMTGGYTWDEIQQVARLLIDHGQRVEITEEKE